MRVPLAVVSLVVLATVVGSATASALSDHGRPTSLSGVSVSRYNLLRTGVATDVGDIRTPAVRWTFATEGAAATSPLAADVDGDGDLEIVLGEYKPGDAGDGSRRGYVLDSGGHLEYSVPMRFNSVAAAVADLDGDGRMELVFSEGSHSDVAGGIGYRVFNGEDGSPLWTFTTPFFGGEGFFASPGVADLNGDGRLDLVAASMDHTVYALRGSDGAVLWRSGNLGHYVRHSPPVADLNGDGNLDLTVETEAGVVYTFDAATGELEWTVDLGDIVAATPAVGDLDGDGRLDIVYSHVAQGGVVALRGNGTVMWQNAAHDFSYRSPTLVDVNGDGLVDVVEGDSDDPSVTAYRGTDGTILWERPLPGPWGSGPLVSADIDGDRRMEVLVGTDRGLTSIDAATGAVEWEFPLPRVRGEPLVRDIDGDGHAEILVGAGDGRLYALGTPPPSDLKHEAILRIKALKERALARGDAWLVKSLDDGEAHVWRSLGFQHPFRPASVEAHPGADVTLTMPARDQVALTLGPSWHPRIHGHSTLRVSWATGVETLVDLPSGWPEKDLHFRGRVRVDAWNQRFDIDSERESKAGIVTLRVRAFDVSLDFTLSLDTETVAGLSFAYETLPLWRDATHLDPKMGHRVFSEEKKAVQKLVSWEGRSDRHSEGPGDAATRCRREARIWTEAERHALTAECDAIANLLVKADEGLARVAIEDAKRTPNPDRHEIKDAEREFAKAQEEWAEFRYGQAIDRFRHAWEEAQEAMGQTPEF